MSDDENLSIYDEIEIEDMTFDAAQQLYHYPCPCGDRFQIALDDLRDEQDIAVCPSCSLMIRVIFDLVRSCRGCVLRVPATDFCRTTCPSLPRRATRAARSPSRPKRSRTIARAVSGFPEISISFSRQTRSASAATEQTATTGLCLMFRDQLTHQGQESPAILRMATSLRCTRTRRPSRPRAVSRRLEVSILERAPVACLQSMGNWPF